MLVLSRQKDESIIIDETIKVKVGKIKGDRVIFHILADGHAINRQEIYEAKKAEGTLTEAFEKAAQRSGYMPLTRKQDQSIIIDHDIRITVVDVRGEKARIGIETPPHISAHREEVYEAIQRERANMRKTHNGNDNPPQP